MAKKTKPPSQVDLDKAILIMSGYPWAREVKEHPHRTRIKCDQLAMSLWLRQRDGTPINDAVLEAARRLRAALAPRAKKAHH